MDTDIGWESSVDGVMLELVGGIFKGEEGVVNRHDGCIRIVESGSHDQAADAAETIDAKSYGHDRSILNEAEMWFVNHFLLCAIS